jgi:hypothetical protein
MSQPSDSEVKKDDAEFNELIDQAKKKKESVGAVELSKHCAVAEPKPNLLANAQVNPNQPIPILTPKTSPLQIPSESPHENFVKLLGKITDAPKFFLEGTAYWVDSALLGDRIKIKGARGIFPSLYVILAGIPSVARKSFLINSGLRVWSGANRSSYWKKSVIMNGTVEGIADAITNYKMDSYTAIYHEFGTTLLEFGSKDYMNGIIGLLSNLYYGEWWKGYLSGHTKAPAMREVPAGTYFTLLGGMQKPKENGYLIPKSFQQGLPRRCDILNTRKGDFPHTRDEWRPYIDEDIDDKYDLEFKTIIEQYRELNKYLYSSVTNSYQGVVPDDPDEKERQFIWALLTPVKNKINDMAWDFYQQTLEHYDDSSAGTLDSEAEKLTKLLVLHAVTHYSFQNNTIGVQEVNYDALQPFFKQYEDRYIELVEQICDEDEESKPTNIYKTKMRVLKYVGNGANTTTVLHSSNMKQRDLVDAVETMLASNELAAIKIIDKVKAFRMLFPSVLFAKEWLKQYKWEETDPARRKLGTRIYGADNYQQFIQDWKD